MSMKCPRCVQRVHRAAARCPHCGFEVSEADEVCGNISVRVQCLTDAAGVLRRKERDAVRRLLAEFQRKFPQLFFAVYYGSLQELPSLQQFGFWLLNRGAFEDLDARRSNNAGVLLSVDVDGKSAGITYGYMLQPFLDDDTTFRALSAAHPFFLQEQYLRATEVVVERLGKSLGRQARRARRNPAVFETSAPADDEESSRILERIRANHRVRETKL
jgi:uncharacterized membrane protein YgcG